MAREHHSGSEVVFQWGIEDGTRPIFSSTTYPSAPSMNYATFYDSPQVDLNTGLSQGYAGGSRIALFKKKAGRWGTVSGAVRVGSVTFLQALIQRDGVHVGYKDLPDLCIDVGFSDAYGDAARTKRHRFCKCTSAAFSYRQDDEIMVTPSFMSLSAPQILGSGFLTPAFSDLAGSADPLHFVNLQSVTVGGTDYRDVITGVNFTVDNMVVGDTVRVDSGDNVPLSRGFNLLKPQGLQISGTLELNTELDTAQVDAAVNSLDWGSIVLNANDTGIGGAQTLITTLHDCLPSTISQQGGDSRQQVKYSVPFTASLLEIADS